MRCDLRLGYHSHIPAILENDQILTPGYQGCFIDSLAAYCDTIVCFLHTPSHRDVFHWDYPIRSKNVRFVSIGPHTSVPHRTIFSNRFTQPIEQWKEKLDVLLIRGPSPLLPAMAKRASALPISLLLVAEYLTSIDTIPQPKWRRELIRLWATWNSKQQLMVAKKALTFVNSRKLYRDLEPHIPNLIEIKTTTLSAETFFKREDTCLSSPYHLLYTGRMSRTKGLLEMVEAVSLLEKEGIEVFLDLVGLPERSDPVLEDIKSLASKLGIANRVIYHGYRPFGPHLFAFYQKADVYVIPTYFEGFPRTIWEAMANSLPVIATKVGSIPDYISGVAELIEPKDALALKNSVLKIIRNSEYRKKIIREGYDLALNNISEQRSKEMVEKIEEFLSTRKRS